MGDELITAGELAQLLRLSLNATRILLQAGDVPGARRVGRQWRISRRVVLEWIEAGERDESHEKSVTDDTH